MALVELPITSGFYVSRSKTISNRICCNLYPHVNKAGSLAERSLYGTAGSNQLASSGGATEANRGAHEKGGIPYFVNGETLYSLNRTVSAQGEETFELVSLGTIEGTARVSMVDNGSQLCIMVPNGKGYIYDENAGTPFQEITDPDFRANGEPQFVRYVDGYFVFSTDADKFIISALNDGLSYNALDFGSAEADPDGIVTPVIINNQLYVAGRVTIEPFRNVGGADFPFQRLDGGVINVGCFAPYSMINAAQTFMFIGGGENEAPAVYAFNGSNVTQISTDAINFILEQLTTEQLENVFAWFYSEGGARFIGWTLPNQTLVYDLTSQEWHERSSRIFIDGLFEEVRWRANSVVQAYNRILVGDFFDGRVGEINLDIYSEYGNDIVRVISTSPFSNLGERLLVPSIELVTESGVSNDYKSAPTISMSRSANGKTFSDPRSLAIGAKGKFDTRTIWRRNGRVARMEVFKWSMSAPIKWVIVTCWADVI